MNETYREIILRLEEKRIQVQILIDCTQQMKGAIARRDAELLGRLLEQRQAGIDAATTLDASLERLCATLPAPAAHRALAILHRNATSVPAQTGEEQLLCRAVQKLAALFFRLRTLDGQLRTLSRGWLPSIPPEKQASAAFRLRL